MVKIGMEIHELKVLTFNIQHGKGLDKKVDLQRIATAIKNSDAAIIGMNEVDKHFSKRSSFDDQPTLLSDLLQMNYAFAPAISIPLKNGLTKQYGNALFTTYEIIDYQTHRFQLKPLLAEPRSILQCRLRKNDIEFDVYVTHFSLHPLLQYKQRLFLQTVAKKANVPLIVMGDFNCRRTSKCYQQLASDFDDCCTYEQKTFPANKPRIQLDYIFTKQFSTEEVAVLPSTASDHLPLAVTLVSK